MRSLPNCGFVFLSAKFTRLLKKKNKKHSTHNRRPQKQSVHSRSRFVNTKCCTSALEFRFPTSPTHVSEHPLLPPSAWLLARARPFSHAFALIKSLHCWIKKKRLERARYRKICAKCTTVSAESAFTASACVPGRSHSLLPVPLLFLLFLLLLHQWQFIFASGSSSQVWGGVCVCF